jgi:hypothetical protein
MVKWSAGRFWLLLFMTTVACGSRDELPAGGVASPARAPARQQVAALPPTPQTASLAAVQRDAPISYNLHRRIDGAVVGSNPAQALKFAITRRGAARIDAASATGWSLSLRLAQVGRAAQVESLPPVRPTFGRNRVALQYGTLSEWYLNGPAGIEQGFDLREKPLPIASGSLLLRMDISGGLRPELAGGEVRLRAADGTTPLRYGKLFARDAGGRLLAASLSVDGNAIVVSVDDRNARYPLRIDPLVWAEQQELLASDGMAGDQFATSVSVSGDTALVGAPGDGIAGPGTGSAYVFVRTNNVWKKQQGLSASYASSTDGFGASVSADGDTALLGAPGANAAYVFVRNNGTWTQQQKLLTTDGGTGENVGRSVSLNGDTAVAGAPYADIQGRAWSGAAYVFVRSGATWTEQQKLAASDFYYDDNFGNSVSVSADTLVVGAATHNAVGSKSGAACAAARRGQSSSSSCRRMAPRAMSSGYPSV